MTNKKTMWIKCPYPGEQQGEGKWYPCTTTYLRRLYKKTTLPKCRSYDEPTD